MNRSLILTPLLCGLACDPLGKNAGVVQPPDTATDTAGDETSTDEGTGDSTGEPPPDVATTSQFFDGAAVTHLLGTDEGVVAVTLAGEPPYDLTVTEYDAAFAEVWSLSLGQGGIRDIAALPGGGYVVGGLTATNTAAAWRLSCCGAIEDQQEYPTMSGDPASIAIAQPLAGGVFMVRDTPGQTPEFIRADLDLVPTATDPSPNQIIIDGAVSPTDTVILRASEGGGADLVLEIEPDGTFDGVGPGEAFRLVGTGSELAMMTMSNPDGVNVQDWESGPVLPVDVPDMVTLPTRTFAADRRGRYAIAHAYAWEGGTLTDLYVANLDGSMALQSILPFSMRPHSGPTAVALSGNGLIWVATADTDTGTELLPDMTGTLHRVEEL